MFIDSVKIVKDSNITALRLKNKYVIIILVLDYIDNSTNTSYKYN